MATLLAALDDLGPLLVSFGNLDALFMTMDDHGIILTARTSWRSTTGEP